jgi:hypothetical protein
VEPATGWSSHQQRAAALHPQKRQARRGLALATRIPKGGRGRGTRSTQPRPDSARRSTNCCCRLVTRTHTNTVVWIVDASDASKFCRKRLSSPDLICLRITGRRRRNALHCLDVPASNATCDVSCGPPRHQHTTQICFACITAPPSNNRRSLSNLTPVAVSEMCTTTDSAGPPSIIITLPLPVPPTRSAPKSVRK